MKTLDWAKLVAVLVVMAAGSWRLGAWKEELRGEGEIRLLTAAKDSSDAQILALADSLALVDALRAIEVAEAKAEADRAHQAEAEAAARAAAVNRERSQLVDSILRTTEHVEEVQAALEVQGASYEQELAEKDVQIAALREAEAKAWSTVSVYEARVIDRDTRIAAQQAQIALRDEIIARREESRGGHGWVVDVALIAGGVAIGVAGTAAAGG